MIALPFRAVAIVAIVLAAAAGVATRISTGPVRFEQRSTIDIVAAALEWGGTLRGFDIVGALPTERGALLLRSPRCESDMIVSAGFVGSAVPQDLRVLGYHESAWTRSFVFLDEVSQTSPRTWAHWRYLALRAWSALSLRSIPLRDQTLFWFLVPSACTLDPTDARGIADDLLRLAHAGA